MQVVHHSHIHEAKRKSHPPHSVQPVMCWSWVTSTPSYSNALHKLHNSLYVSYVYQSNFTSTSPPNPPNPPKVPSDPTQSQRALVSPSSSELRRDRGP